MSNSSNNCEGVLNFLLFFFYDKILHAQKAQKEYKAPKIRKDSLKYFFKLFYTHRKRKKNARHQKRPKGTNAF